ncbi:MAG: cupredoxin domain-containing protein [Polyangiaceae bacterium]|nr:cupredoxin domain-containing protein [Polyangiaceae bacterium]
MSSIRTVSIRTVSIRTASILAALSLFAGCRSSSAPAPSASAEPSAGARAEHAITVDATGYHPAAVRAPAGKPVRLTFTRTSDDGCGAQLVFPTLNLRRDLPLDRQVSVDLTMPASGNVAFTCGMGMMKGSVVAE